MQNRQDLNSHRIEMIIQVARNDVINEEGEEKKK